MSCANVDGWEVVQINLRRIDGSPDAWTYIVTFRPTFEVASGSHIGSRLARLIEVPVLLSGAVPKASANAAATRR